MYALQLTTSYCPAQTDLPLLQTTVGGVLRETAARTPDAPALHEVDGDGQLARHWTYAQLLADSERLAHALLTRFAPGERVAVWAPNIPEWVIAEFAMGLAGIVLVTVNPGYQPRELKYVLEQSGAVGLLLVPDYRGNPMAKIAAEVAAGIPQLREITDMTDAAALYASTGPARDLPVVAPRDAAQIQYTSGTTGFPKGVVLHHHGITNNLRHSYTRNGTTAAETVVLMTPLFHTSGCGAILGAVQFGCRILLVKLFNPTVVNALIETEKVASFVGVPTMLLAMLEADRLQPRDFSSVSLIASGGAMVPPELIRQITERYGCRFSTVYGQTETSPLLTQTRPDDAFDDLCESVGQVVPHIELSIRAPATNAVVPVGAVGEICARGYALMLGYHDNPQATAATIDADGWIHTGDLGAIDARGFVRVTGRVKEMIIRGGENLFP
ncbi:MAG: AMP-binding protein, partial [Polymorphobacter sp.]